MALSAKKYLVCSLSVTAVLVLGVGVLNYVADPCGIYHHGKSWDWIRSRPEALELAFIFKAQAVEAVRPDTIFMGSSRSAEGLDPHAPGVPAPAFNLGLPGSSLYEQWRYLQHASSVHMPATVVIGVDMNQFTARRNPNPLFSEDRLRVRPDGTPTPVVNQMFADLVPTLFSLSTAQLSVHTLEAQRGARLTFDDGYEPDAPKYSEHLDLTKSVYAANKKWLAESATANFRDINGRMPEVEVFDQLLAFCADHHVHLIMFLQPVHSAALDGYTHDWALYSDWLKTLVAHVEGHAGLKSEFWDFTGYNSISTEPFPDPKSTYSNMRYYWEGSHYRKAVGDLVLERVFTGTGPQGYGHLITTANIDEDLQRVAGEKKAWHERHEMVQLDLPATQAASNP